MEIYERYPYLKEMVEDELAYMHRKSRHQPENLSKPKKSKQKKKRSRKRR